MNVKYKYFRELGGPGIRGPGSGWAGPGARLPISI
jgi:hypothetical protein